MNVSIDKLPVSLQKTTLDALEQIGVKVVSSGYPIYATAGDKFAVTFDGSAYRIVYPSLRYYYRALLEIKKGGDKTPFHFEQTCGASELGVMIDSSRNAVQNLEHFKKTVRLLALLGYNQIQLYMEDTYEVENEPYFGYMRGRFTMQEMKAMDEYADQFGIELVPCIQTLAHFRTLFRWSAAYGDIHDFADILLIGEEKTYQFIDHIFSTLSKCFRSKKIHLGMDEAWALSRGKYQDKHGLVKDKVSLILSHLSKVVDLAKKYGYEPMMWSDMFFREEFHVDYFTANEALHFSDEIKARYPKDVRLVYWDYYNRKQETYENMLRLHKELTDNVMFAGGAWTWTGYTPQNDFSIFTTRLALQACEKYGCDKFMLTMWGDDGAECSILGVLPTLVYTADYFFSLKDGYKETFEALTGISYDDFTVLDLPNKIDVNEAPNVDNRAKYMLFNDLLGGLFDGFGAIGQAKIYEDHAKEIERVEKKAGDYAYLFTVQKYLCKVLALKYDFGARARKAYKGNDKATLKALSESIVGLGEELSRFYDAYRVQWMKENKTIGFEVQDLRLGGLIKRVENCKKILDEYLSGKTQKIEELEQELLNPINFEMKWTGFAYHLLNVTANYS